MLRRVGALVLAFVWCPAVLLAANGLGPTDPDARTYTLTRTVSIPLKVLNTTQSASSDGNPNASTLLSSPGAQDELPEGPDGFEVLEDGRLLISDPLRERVAIFDAQGKFQQSWKLDFSPDSITFAGHDLLAVRDAVTGQLHGFNVNGSPQSLPGDAPPNPGEATLQSGNTAVVTLRASAGGATQPLQINFNQPGMSLLSVEVLAVDSNGNPYLALESTKGGDQVSVEKDVRKYSPSGKLLGQIVQIPLDYYIPPVNELRVRDGSVYQLYTTKSEVRINIWNTR